MNQLRLIVLLVLFFAPVLAYGESGIARFVFITEPQTIAVEAVSDTITLQSQDLAGNSVVLPQTACLLFNSVSSQGQFSSNATNWNPVSVLTMNKGWANRNFYYKDGASGEHTLSVQVALKPESESRSCANWPSEEWNIEWTAAQNIIVGDGSGSETTEEVSEADTSPSQNSTTISAHEPRQMIEVDAGAPTRVALAGAYAIFDGDMRGLNGASISNKRFLWSFGDGSIKEGESIAHTYQYPGEYIVILEGSAGEYSASDKIVVTVVPANISIVTVGSHDDFFISLKNETKYEINLEGWVLRSGNTRFMIPKNTLIGSGKMLQFSPQVTGLSYSNDVALLYPNNTTASVHTPTAKLVPSSPIVTTVLENIDSKESQEDPVLNNEESDLVETHVVATASALNQNSSIIKWLFGLAGIMFVGLLGFFFVSRIPLPQELHRASAAEDFTIFEEKG